MSSTVAPAAEENALGTYLKDRRARLDPAAFGFPAQRRRTPGLRREEVAQRAHVSATWYTWLEQGRGGAPSADVLDRLARALALSEVEREHLYLLAQGRPPEVRAQPSSSVSPGLQRVLDSLETSPAFVKNAVWDILAWNEAAAAVLIDYAALAPEQRNVLRLIFGNARIRASLPEWPTVARFVVAAFRADVARTGSTPRAQSLVDEMSRDSPDFAEMWLERDVRTYGEGLKSVHPAGSKPISLEYSAFAVDSQPGLSMVIYTPASSADVFKVKALIGRRRRQKQW